MKALFAALMVVATTAWADTTPNLITNQPGISGTGVWTGVGGYSQLNGQHPITLWGCCTSYSGSAPFLDTSTGGPNGQSGQIIWSYGQATVAQVIAINQALSGTGIQISGYNWGYEVRNMNGDDRQGSVDTLTATTYMTNLAGATILSDTRVYNTKQEWNWYGGTVTAPTAYALPDVGNLGVQFTSADSGFWGGYYGPQVRNVSLSLNYSVDPCAVDPQSSPSCPGFRTYHNMTDDGYAQVNLPFSFPLYGNTYTTSYMFTNGVVGFLNTNLGGYCCDGVDLNQQRFTNNTAWDFAIFALNTDLYPGPNSQFYTQHTDNGTGLRYTWRDVIEIGTNNENTFSVNIKDSGYIGINYEKVNLSAGRRPLIGAAGDISQGQYSQYYYGAASNLPNLAGITLQYSGTELTDICASNPLINASCPGYAVAYHDQQCGINALYASTCAGYATAYHDQQCSLDPLYANTCAGYAQAYYNQQCTVSALYDTQCPGYAQAYYNQQCDLDPFYDRQCPGYNEAYAKKNILNLDTTTAAASTDTDTPATEPESTTQTVVAIAVVESDSITAGTASTAPAPATSVTSPTSVSPAAVTSVVKPAPAPPTLAPSARAAAAESARAETRAAEQKQEQKKTERAIARILPRAASSGSSEKAAAERAQSAAAEAVEQAATATTIEAQQAAQNLVLGLMGYNPAFSAYQNSIVPDTNAATMARQYNKPAVDNRRALRALSGASDRLHQDMVDQQYGRMP